jgi:isopropylmalate/homocitrate/citramalate synthase
MKTLPQKIRFLDNTLRDGEQTPGVVFNSQKKTALVKAIAEIGIEAAEVGFPALSDDERHSIKQIVDLSLPIEITVLCRPIKKDINYAYQCGIKSIRILLPKSTYCITNLGIDPKEIVLRVVEMTEYAIGLGLIVRVIYEDAARSNQKDVIACFKMLALTGVHTLSFADTGGAMTPFETFNRIKEIVSEVKCPIGIHCHNDLGLATANTLSAIEAGAVEIETCINGIGERAGNTAFEEIAILLNQYYITNLSIKFDLLDSLSQLVSQYSNIPISPQKPIVGSYAFLHESGIHANSIIQGEKIYESFSPSIIGRDHKIIVGKHSSLLSIQKFLREQKIDLSIEMQKQFLLYVKEKVEKGWNIKDIITNFKKNYPSIHT